VTAETVEQKAGRYLCEGRVRVLRVTPDLVTATVRGSDGIAYRVVREAGKSTSCTCPAYGKRCCHRIALELVT
jgi:uncharacterized Zn finger protein